MDLDTGRARVSSGKVHTRVLLRESYREDDKIKHRTVANLSKALAEEVAAIKLAIEHQHDLESTVLQGLAGEMQANRQSKPDSLSKRVAQANLSLTEHPRAKVATALKSLQTRIAKPKLSFRVSVGQAGDRREVELRTDEEERGEETKPDGCYGLKTDLTNQQADKETLHSRFKDLALWSRPSASLKPWSWRCAPFMCAARPARGGTRGHEGARGGTRGHEGARAGVDAGLYPHEGTGAPVERSGPDRPGRHRPTRHLLRHGSRQRRPIGLRQRAGAPPGRGGTHLPARHRGGCRRRPNPPPKEAIKKKGDQRSIPKESGRLARIL